MDNGVYWQLLEPIAIVAVVVLYVVGVTLSEAYAPLGAWIARRTGFADSGQSPAVYRCAVRLASRKRSERMRALELLYDLRDPTAVPALLRAIQRYNRDAQLVEAAVCVLGKLGDSRALPTLRGLTHGRNLSLMEAARAAVSHLEPRATLLRSANGSGHDELLRPASANACAENLVRPT